MHCIALHCIARIVDEHLRPQLVKIVEPIQNDSQYGFTSNTSYLMGALQRHETEKYCVDQKRTFFGCSLDGEAAFEAVNRTIMMRELYCAGETGQYWVASYNSYQNSQSKIKLNGMLSDSLTENRGVKQGQIKSSDHFKIYINPLLNAIDNSNLGVWIGPLNVGQSACADDEFIMTDEQDKLQSLLDIAEFYGKMYQVKYGASKTKITIVGSEVDRKYFQEVSPWKLNGQTVMVEDDNEHLGQVVSGLDQEKKNVDLRLSKGRGALFSLLGPAFQHKSFLGPKARHHIYRTYVTPIVLSGLSSIVLRKADLAPLTGFHRKTLRGILRFSKTSNIPAIHFLLGELPIEGQLHRDTFSLLYSVWANPQSKIYSIVKYLLKTSSSNSRTWSMYVRFLAQKYGLPDPLTTLESDLRSKSNFKESVMTKISAFHENDLRQMAVNNSRMNYLNVSLLSLRGRYHPALNNLITPHDVEKSRHHLKMLAGDYYTYQIKASQSGGSPHCRVCDSDENTPEDTAHMISTCNAYTDTRERIKKQLKQICTENIQYLDFEHISSNTNTFCQFILDPSSMNLEHRVHINDPFLGEVFKLSRNLCYAIHTTRMKILTSKADSH